jgi:hypothetical protein
VKRSASSSCGSGLDDLAFFVDGGAALLIAFFMVHGGIVLHFTIPI